VGKGVHTIRYLFDCGYKLRYEVKGVSHALVDRITASSGDHTQINVDDPLPMSPSAPIIIPRALWQGKENAAVVQAMRERKDKDSVTEARGVVTQHHAAIGNPQPSFPR
jgi:hypothetical protein